MKKNLYLTGLLAVSLLAGAPLVHANKGMEDINSPDYVSKKLGKLTSELQLTPDQQSQIRPLLEDKKTRMQAATTDDQRKEIKNDFKNRMDAVLNDAQKSKYDNMHKEHRKNKKGAMKSDKKSSDRMDRQSSAAGSGSYGSGNAGMSNENVPNPQQSAKPQGTNESSTPAGY